MFDQDTAGDDNGDYENYIKESAKTFSWVQIFFDYTQPTTIITKDAKVTAADMVSNIGGTIGIFLGLSTISLLDLIIEWFHWAYKKVARKNRFSGKHH